MAADESVGNIKTLKGEVIIYRQGKEAAAVLGAKVFQEDEIQTQDGGRVGIILRDDTILSLGPKSRLALTEYIFEPKENRFSVVINMMKGTFSYLSGVIGKLSPDSIRLETPDSTIAIRGTRLMISVEAP